MQGIIRQGLNKGKNHFLRRLYNSRVQSIQLYIFDLIRPKIDAVKRVAFLEDHATNSENICTLPTWLVANEGEAKEFYNKCIDEGFEGTVYRKTTSCYGDKDGLYRMKPVHEMGCILLGWKDKGTVKLQVHDGPEFYCSGMSERSAKMIYQHYNKGDMIPILYDSFNKNGRPTFTRINNDLIN